MCLCNKKAEIQFKVTSQFGAFVAALISNFTLLTLKLIMTLYYFSSKSKSHQEMSRIYIYILRSCQLINIRQSFCAIWNRSRRSSSGKLEILIEFPPHLNNQNRYARMHNIYIHSGITQKV